MALLYDCHCMISSLNSTKFFTVAFSISKIFYLKTWNFETFSISDKIIWFHECHENRVLLGFTGNQMLRMPD